MEKWTVELRACDAAQNIFLDNLTNEELAGLQAVETRSQRVYKEGYNGQPYDCIPRLTVRRRTEHDKEGQVM